ncbi:MAG: phospholipase, partial [Cytophagia bacterium]|nr:phospholipase [Cytophagia bacterium]
MQAFSQTSSAFQPYIYINEKADTLLYQMLSPQADIKNQKLPLVIFL